MSEYTPFREQHVEALTRRAIEKSLDRVKAQGRVAKSGSGKPGDADAQPDRKVSFRGWTPTHIAMWLGKPLPKSATSAQGSTAQAALEQKREKRKPRHLFTAAPGTPVKFLSPDDKTWYYAKILRLVPTPGGVMVRVATTVGDWDLDPEDVHPVTSDELEAKKLRDLARQEAAGADLATHTDDDIRPGQIVSYADEEANETKVVVVARVFDRYGHGVVGVDGKGQTHFFKPGQVSAFHRPEDLP